MYETFYGCLNCNWDILVDLQAMRPNKKHVILHVTGINECLELRYILNAYM